MKRILTIIIVLAAIVGVIVLKKGQQEATSPLPSHTPGMPRLLDLGSKSCTACTMLEPVLEELRSNHVGRLQVDFIDVWEHEQVATDYGVEIIPVQIFFDASGKELYRHQGFISVQDIEAKFAEVGIDLTRHLTTDYEPRNTRSTRKQAE
ncbi:MAG: thioredoxin family protein [Verrucomicrobia bacterium]|nr:thioredoxin family protein [Verrucomicrobiota bacterium]